MRLVIDKNTYIPIYRANMDCFDIEYEAYIRMFQNSFIVSLQVFSQYMMP